MYVCIQICMYVCMYVYIYIYIYIYTHIISLELSVCASRGSFSDMRDFLGWPRPGWLEIA